MKKTAFFTLVLLLFLMSGAEIVAQVPTPTVTPSPTPVPRGTIISLPANNSTVSGRVRVFGSAWVENFDRYEVYRIEGSRAIFMFDKKEPVINGVLYEWDTVGLKDGTYGLLVRAVRKDGNYREARVTVRVDNTSTPTPTATPTEAASPTPEPTRTPLILPGATVTRVAPPAPAITPRPVEGSLLAGLPSISIDPTACLRPFITGAIASLAFFLFVGFMALIKRLLGQ